MDAEKNVADSGEALRALALEVVEERRVADIQVESAITALKEAEAARQDLLEKEAVLISWLRKKHSIELGDSLTEPPEQSRTQDDWSAKPRTTAVGLAVVELTKQKGEATLPDIRRLLGVKKRDDALPDISAALSHLKRADKVTNPHFGRWVALGTEVSSQ